jgi:ATP-dependent DNA helicase RecG
VAQLKLDTPIQYVPGVGPTRAAQLAELGVSTVEELLTYYPRRFDLRKQAQPIGSLRGDEPSVTVAGVVRDVEERTSGRLPFLQCCIEDDSGWVFVKWFHGGYLRERIKPGVTIAVSGKVSVYKEYPQFINPRHQIIYDPQSTNLDEDELLPVYPAGGKLTSGNIAYIIKRVLPQAVDLLPRLLDREYLSQRALMERPAAVAAMHRPEDREQWGQARRRLAYDECLLMQLAIAMTRMKEVSRPAHPIPASPEIDRRIRSRFPFALTPAQDAAVSEIAVDLGRRRPMNRLLQGDVGSGKTVVAVYAALLAVANRKQAAIMAPTEILATQHFQKIQNYLAGSRVRTAMLVGSQSAAERAEILQKLEQGEIDIVVGTHALLGEGVRFSQLALVVVDEQHKFGVRQRSGMRGKGFAPHYLVMTATPIPRTLAMTLFGDLDVSVISSLPPGRGKTFTRCMGHEQMEEVLSLVASRLREGQQAYFIYPLVNPSPQLALKAAGEAHTELAKGELAEFGVGMIHGQMPAAQKDKVMRQFHAGQIKVLVASVVVEVGLDVPAANVMVVMHAERFGLAQLHQLRGRIGRSSADALCLLVASPNNPVAKRRLEVLEETSDGFRIAEEDLRIRGPGEIFSTRQHGLPELKVADLIEDFELLRLARRDAFQIVMEDPHLDAPHHQQLRAELLKLYGARLDLLAGA